MAGPLRNLGLIPFRGIAGITSARASQLGPCVFV